MKRNTNLQILNYLALASAVIKTDESASDAVKKNLASTFDTHRKIEKDYAAKEKSNKKEKVEA